jgi:hypothetical protein
VTENAIVTPDGDVYFERLGEPCDEIAAVRFSKSWWPPPLGVPRNLTYRFPSEPTDAQVTRWRVEAEVAAKVEHRARGTPVVGGVALLPLEEEGSRTPVIGGVLPAKRSKESVATEPLDLSAWIVFESVGEPSWLGRRLSEVAPSAVLVCGSSGRGVWRLVDGREFFAYKEGTDVKSNTESPGDARVLPLVRQRGSRWRDWNTVVDAMQEEVVSDFALAPRSASWCVAWLKRAGGPTMHHENWRTRRKLGQFDYGVQEHLSLATIIEDLGCWDQLDLTNLLGIERAFRKMQMIEHHYDERQRDKYDNGRMPPEEMEAFMGGPLGGRPVSMVCPVVLDDIAKQLERVAGIKKNARKLREEAKNDKPPKGGGKYGG